MLCIYSVHIATISILNYIVGHSFVSYSTKKVVSVTKLLDKIWISVLFKVLEQDKSIFFLKYLKYWNVTS